MFPSTETYNEVENIVEDDAKGKCKILESVELRTLHDTVYHSHFIVMTGKFAFDLLRGMLTIISSVEYSHCLVQQRIRLSRYVRGMKTFSSGARTNCMVFCAKMAMYSSVASLNSSVQSRRDCVSGSPIRMVASSGDLRQAE
jgi:hypothetical protein